MTWLAAIAREGWALFADDGVLAVLALGWITAVWLLPGADWVRAVALTGGLLAILAESTQRAARKAKARRARTART